MSKIIGIDLGTTNSAVAVMMGDSPIIIPSAEGERLVPSVVAVNKNGERIVGRPARNQAIINAQNTIFSVKRFMGRKLNDEMVQNALRRIPYSVVASPNGDACLRLAGQDYAPPEISAMILAKLKADAEAYLGEPILQAVITVPAYFDDVQRNATKDAGRIAGLEVLRIINEPTASALAYGLDKTKGGTIVIYDLGGGTFDVSILKVGDGVFEVCATSGDTFLGGDDFDQRVMDFLIKEFEREHNLSLSAEKQALQRIKEAAEKAKIELSSMLQTEINLPYLMADASGPKHLTVSLTRARLEQLTADLIERTLPPLRQALQDAGLTSSKVQDVVLVGGMTRMPAIQEAVKNFFNQDLHKGVNPDEVVALGAAIQGGVLNGQVKDLLLLDITPLTLSIETMGGVATPVLERNTAIPTRKTEVFSTAADNQPQVEIHIVQGERPMAADNKNLGQFILSGIPPAPRGIPQIEVTFDIDVNGILKVAARDKTTGRSHQIVIKSSSGLSGDEIERMRQDATAHAQTDLERRDAADARNQADQAIFNAEQLLRAHGPQIPTVVSQEISAAILGLKDIFKSGDLHLLKTRTSLLNLALQAVHGQPSHFDSDAQTKIL